MDQRYEHILYRNIKNQIDTEKKKTLNASSKQ